MSTNSGRNYLERIAYLSYFFYQTHEEHGGNGHSMLIKLFNPAAGKISMTALRSVVLHGFVSQQKLSITETAVETAKWLRSEGFAPCEIAGEQDQLQEISRRYEGTFDLPHSVRNIKVCLRLVRFLWLMYAHDVGSHSRAVEYFFPNDEILIGRSADAPTSGYHPEHVVPCAYIRDEVLRRFVDRPLVVDGKEDELCARDMCQFVDRLMAVAYISKAEAAYLDTGEKAIKSTMPAGWNPESGDILDRLNQIPGFTSLLPIA
jgi:hypothetical protein